MGGYKPNRLGIGEMLRGPEMVAEMKRRADAIKDAAEADAPIGPPSDRHRGEYKGAFSVESGVTEDVQGNARAYAKVLNNAPHAVDVEYGGGGRANSPKTSAHHTLARAMDAARG